MTRSNDETNDTGPGPGRTTALRISAAVLALAGLLTAAPMAGPPPAHAQQSERIDVVTTLPTYADIARRIGGDRARVRAIARGDEDPHFVTPRPSYAQMISDADMFVTTGLDLELWVPGLLDRANNSRVVEGAEGHVTAYSGVKMLQVPESVSRAEGDIHVFGNPHVHTDPVNGIVIARNILRGLKRVDPRGSATYEKRTRAFEDSVLRRTFGDTLVQMVGGDALFQLGRAHKFWSFAQNQTVDGKPLTDFIGGWLAQAAPFRGKQMACYHKNWAYFSHRFRIGCAIYVEPKPGIPPSPGHVRKVIDLMRSENIPVLFSANYFSEQQVRRVADRVGGTAIRVPEHVGGAEGVDGYFELIDLWVTRLSEAYRAASASAAAGPGSRDASAASGKGGSSR